MAVIRLGGLRNSAQVKSSPWACLIPLGAVSVAFYAFGVKTLVTTLRDIWVERKQSVRPLVELAHNATWWDYAVHYSDEVIAGLVMATLLFGMVMAGQRQITLGDNAFAVRNALGFTRYRPLAGITSVTAVYSMPLWPSSVWVRYAGHRLPVLVSGLGMSNRDVRQFAHLVRQAAGLR
jgi:hypothetical protein